MTATTDPLIATTPSARPAFARRRPAGLARVPPRAQRTSGALAKIDIQNIQKSASRDRSRPTPCISSRGSYRRRRGGAMTTAAAFDDIGGSVPDATAAAAAAGYVPSPMDASLLFPQLASLAVIAIAVGYVQVVLTPTARVKFDAADEDRRAYLRELMASEGTAGDDRGVERWWTRLWLKPIPRPRGDQTKGGTVIPGVSPEAPRAKGGRSRSASDPGNGGGVTETNDDDADRGR